MHYGLREGLNLSDDERVWKRHRDEPCAVYEVDRATAIAETLAMVRYFMRTATAVSSGVSPLTTTALRSPDQQSSSPTNVPRL